MRRAPPAVVVAALCAAGLVAAPSCLAPKGFRCDADGECGGGFCETTRYCSLADATCPSGRRYAELAGPDLADACVEPCPAGTGDCERAQADGCETDLTSSLAHCGGCDRPCALDHATPACAASACAITACADGWADCDGEDATGCERSTQTDPDHCGACDHGCQGGGCAGGLCQPVLLAALGAPEIHGLAVDATGVYAAEFADGGRIVRVAAGGTVEELAAGQARPEGLAVGADDVFWAASAGGAVLRVSKTQSEIPTTLKAGLDRPQRVALDATSVYVTTLGGAVWRLDQATGAGPSLAAAESLPIGVAVAGADVYWAAFGGDTLRVSRAGGAAMSLVTGQDGATHVAVAGGRVYWTAYNAQTVMSAATDGTGVAPVATGQPGGGLGLAVDGAEVYFTTPTTVVRAAADGSQTTVLHTGAGIGALAVDATFLYFSEGGAVKRMAR